MSNHALLWRLYYRFFSLNSTRLLSVSIGRFLESGQLPELQSWDSQLHSTTFHLKACTQMDMDTHRHIKVHSISCGGAFSFKPVRLKRNKESLSFVLWFMQFVPVGRNPRISDRRERCNSPLFMCGLSAGELPLGDSRTKEEARGRVCSLC